MATRHRWVLFDHPPASFPAITRSTCSPAVRGGASSDRGISNFPSRRPPDARDHHHRASCLPDPGTAACGRRQPATFGQGTLFSAATDSAVRLEFGGVVAADVGLSEDRAGKIWGLFAQAIERRNKAASDESQIRATSHLIAWRCEAPAGSAGPRMKRPWCDRWVVGFFRADSCRLDLSSASCESTGTSRSESWYF